MSRLKSRTDILSAVFFAVAAVVPTVAAFQSNRVSSQPSVAAGRQFAVEDDLRLSGNSSNDNSLKTSPNAAPQTRSPQVPTLAPPLVPTGSGELKLGGAKQVGGALAKDGKGELEKNIEPIRLTLEPKTDVVAAWDAHFAAHTESSEAVRATVRLLMKDDKPDQCAAVIMSAIKHKQAQPWMYEALGLAMELQGARVSEIERALMSAVDFGSQPDDLLKVADYMLNSNLGGGALQRRALDLYRQVAKLQPWRQEPYICGLHLAQHLDDVEGLKWSTLGIVGQAWPREQRAFAEKALNTAEGLVARLKVEKKLAEAEKFQAALSEAKVRDCVITVSWSGDADVDLTVDEPTGAVCSYRHPRSTGGGVLIDDTFDKASGLHTETYVCPQGFNGDYRILAKRVWGKVIADTLSVAIIAHKDAPNERKLSRSVQLKEDRAILSFDLQNGRRTESLTEAQVVNAVKSALAVNHSLAQQLAAASDPTVRGAVRDPRLDPALFLRGSAGYQPVIITLPTGTNMSATAVVSHDRRYVRISAQPVFSTIPNVNTFNYQTGSSGDGNTGNTGNTNMGMGNIGNIQGPIGGPQPPGFICNQTGPAPVPATLLAGDYPPITNGLRVAIAPWYGWYSGPRVIAGGNAQVQFVANGADPCNHFLRVGNTGPTRLTAGGPGGLDALRFNSPFPATVGEVVRMQSVTGLTTAQPIPGGLHFFMLGRVQRRPIDPLAVPPSRPPQVIVDGATGNSSGFRIWEVGDRSPITPDPGAGATVPRETFAGFFATFPQPGSFFGVNLSYPLAAVPTFRIFDFGCTPGQTSTQFVGVLGSINSEFRYGLTTPPAGSTFRTPANGGSVLVNGLPYDFYTPFTVSDVSSYTRDLTPVVIGSAKDATFPAEFDVTCILIYTSQLTYTQVQSIVTWMNTRAANSAFSPLTFSPP